jgi:glycosyltransferase involved in cell wall biosynthesis
MASAVRHIDRDRFDVDIAYVLPHKNALVGTIEQEGIRVHCLGTGDRTHTRWPARLRRLVADGRIDIVHTHMPLSAAIARVVVPHRTRLVHTEHNMWQRHHPATRWANRLTLRRNDAVLAVSASVARSIRSGLPTGERRAVEVLYHGIDIDAFGGCRSPDAVARARALLDLGPDDLVIGSVGNFTPKKDHRTLLHATAEVVQRLPSARLVLVGDGPLRESLEQSVRDLGLSSRVRFAGPRDDVPSLLAAFDVFCLSSRYEGLSIALLEAMAARVPAVATAVGGIPEVVQANRSGLLVQPGDPHALAAALVAVLTDPALASELMEAGWRRAAEFDIARATDRLQALYAELLVPC